MVEEWIDLSIFGDMDVVVTGDHVSRTSPRSRMRTLQRGGRDIILVRQGEQTVLGTNRL